MGGKEGPGDMPIRVAVGDDDGGFRKAAVGLLEADPRFEVVGEAADGAELLDLAGRPSRTWSCWTCGCPPEAPSARRRCPTFHGARPPHVDARRGGHGRHLP